MTSSGVSLVSRQLVSGVRELGVVSADVPAVYSSRLVSRSLITHFGFRVWAEFEGLRRSEVPVCDLAGVPVRFYSTRDEDSDLVVLCTAGRSLSLHLPPARLAPAACEVYQVLRSDGVEPARAAALCLSLSSAPPAGEGA